MFAEPIWEARHKSCIAHLAQFGNEMDIQAIMSREEGKGHASEMIEALKKWCESKSYELVSSIPISDPWEHLCKKYNLKTY